jgi:hypothetical protein
MHCVQELNAQSRLIRDGLWVKNVLLPWFAVSLLLGKPQT